MLNEGVADWRMSIKQFLFLLVLRQKSILNYFAGKLNFLSPLNGFMGHQGGI